jgi:hypothetical protein
VAVITAALAGKTVRASLGGEWPVAGFIVSKMTRAPKCRATDDLLMPAELHPAYERSRRGLSGRSTRDLLNIGAGSAALPTRARALWYAVGTNRYQSRHLQARRGAPAIVFGVLRDAGFPRAVVEDAQDGFRDFWRSVSDQNHLPHGRRERLRGPQGMEDWNMGKNRKAGQAHAAGDGPGGNAVGDGAGVRPWLRAWLKDQARRVCPDRDPSGRHPPAVAARDLQQAEHPGASVFIGQDRLWGERPPHDRGP